MTAFKPNKIGLPSDKGYWTNPWTMIDYIRDRRNKLNWQNWGSQKNWSRLARWQERNSQKSTLIFWRLTNNYPWTTTRVCQGMGPEHDENEIQRRLPCISISHTAKITMKFWEQTYKTNVKAMIESYWLFARTSAKSRKLNLLIPH